jgi:hypothetical protein
MRKSTIILGLAVIIIFTGMFSMFVVNTYGRETDNAIITINMSQHGMMGFASEINNYERAYLHLNTENQTKIDLAFASELLSVNMQGYSNLEVVEVIHQVKSNILDTIQFEYTSQRYGMMGGNMMRYNSNDQYTSCGYQNRVNSYEWLYTHSDEEQKLNFDLKFANAIMQLDMDSLTATELVEKISEIKLALIDQVLNPVQSNE